MSSEKFCLRWNDFESNISSAFKELRDDKDFFDITLACDDEQIQAHKVILSACSPFFRNVLRRNPHQHPLLYLKGVKYTDLQSVLNFMYHGEVNVAQEELNSFLSVAEDLRVKGLTQNQTGSQNTSQLSTSNEFSKNIPVSKTIHQKPSDRNPPPKIPCPAPPLHKPSPDDDIQEFTPIKSEPHDTPNQINSKNTLQHHTTPCHYSSPQPVALAEEDSILTNYQEEGEGYEEFDQYEDQYSEQQGGVQMAQGQEIEKGYVDYPSVKSPTDLLSFCSKSPGSSKWVCSICGHFSHSGRHQVRNHVESKHFPTSFQYQCEHCDKICCTKKGMERHVSEKHRNQNNYYL